MLYKSPFDKLLHSWHGFLLPSCQVCPCTGMAEQVHRVSQEVVAGKPLWWGGDTGCCSSTILSGYSCTLLLATEVLESKEHPEVWRRNEDMPKIKLCLDCSFWTISNLYTVSLGIGSVSFCWTCAQWIFLTLLCLGFVQVWDYRDKFRQTCQRTYGL